MSGGLNSLLKYRFQRKDEPKISSSSLTVTKACGSGTQQRKPTLTAVGDTSMPDTPESISSTDSHSPSVSPVFPGGKPTLTRSVNPKQMKRGAIVIHSSDSEPESPQIQRRVPSSSDSGPWLSKERGKVVQNGNITPTKATVTAKFSTLSARTPVNTEDPSEYDFRNKVVQLKSMFPSVNQSSLETMIRRCGGDLELAIDTIISQNTPDQQSPVQKRKRVCMMSNSSDSEAVPTPVKKARPLSYSDSQNSMMSNSQVATVSAACVDNHTETMDFLQDAFPDIGKEVLEKALRDNKMDYDATVAALAQYQPPAEPVVVDQTKNVGSIKAFQAARVKVRTGSKVSMDNDDSDDEAEYGAMNRSREKRLGNDDVIDLDSDDSSADEVDNSTDGQILAFFNEASLNELLCMKGCSTKKAECLIGLRPFENWEDLVAKFEHAEKVTLPFTLITECKDVIRMRRTVHQLMMRCERISRQLKSVISQIASQINTDQLEARGGCISTQPSLLNKSMTLTPYQMVGLNWLALMHRRDLDGILGDEMGLGKTVQTIAFLAYMLEMGDKGPHAIIVPSSTIDNWLRELQLWCPSLKVLLYYGSQEERRDLRAGLMDNTIGHFHVLVTTYNMAAGNTEDRNMFKKQKFHYAIFDEGHMLKNMSSMRYRSLMRITTQRRLLLTGTPLQNNLLELISLLNFVMPSMFADETDNFKRIFTTISSRTKDESRGAYEKEVIAHAKEILRPFMLRRLKSQVLSQLPAKKEFIERLPMSYEQQELYDELKTTFGRRMNEGSDGQKKGGMSGAHMLMQLRKACNHPLLHRRHYTTTKLRQMAKLMTKEPTHRDAEPDLVYEDMEVMSDFELHRLCLQYDSVGEFTLDDDVILDSGKFRHLDELLDDLKSREHRVLIFSQFTMMMDILEYYMDLREHRYLRLDGSTPVAERQDMLDQFNTDKTIFIFLLSTKAGGLGINLTAASTVIVHDIDFNPYNDKQAEDRCHRLGQKNEVTVYKLISKNTIEEAMLRCGQAKLKLEEDVTGQNTGDELNTNDVASLLKEALLDTTDDSELL